MTSLSETEARALQGCKLANVYPGGLVETVIDSAGRASCAVSRILDAIENLNCLKIPDRSADIG
jgi:hypothetical protein